MRIKIVDSFWKIKLLTRDAFNKQFGDGWALTDTENKVVYFCRDNTTRNTVNHEMIHVWFSLAFVASSSLNMEQTEEVMAELMGKYAEDYIKSCRKVYNWLKKEMSK